MQLLKLDLQFFAGEKTEKATPRKRQDARKKGQTAKSADINTAAGLIAVFFCLMILGPYFQTHTAGLMRAIFQNYLLMELTENNLQMLMVKVSSETAFILAPVLIVSVIAAVAANFLQVGVLFSTESIQPKLDKINPLQGFKRIYSIRALVELCKSLLKIGVVGGVAGAVIWSKIGEIVRLPHMPLQSSIGFLGSLTIQLGLSASIALLFLAFLDYFYQKFDFEKNIRMSKQDIKDEYKKSEGDPLIKSKIKQRQREMAMRRMMQDVPKADVIITNPTHFAIALKYDEEKMDAPYVVAKGVDFVAQKIKETAKENGVSMVENRPLARSLYSQVEIGRAVPEEFFKAVAEILAYVYRLKQKI